jgi:hypothetical protein
VSRYKRKGKERKGKERKGKEKEDAPETKSSKLCLNSTLVVKLTGSN